MRTLYDDFNPHNNRTGPMNGLYRASEGKLAGKALLFAGSRPVSPPDIDLWFSELLTGTLQCETGSRERLRQYVNLTREDLTPEEKKALDKQAELYARMCVLFSELVIS